MNIQARVFQPLTSKPGLQATDVKQDQPGLSGQRTRAASKIIDDTDSAGNVNKEQARRDSKSITQSLFDTSYTKFLQVKKIPEWMLQREAWFGPSLSAKSEEGMQSMEEGPVTNATKILPSLNNVEGHVLSNGYRSPRKETPPHCPERILEGVATVDATPNTSNAYPNTEERARSVFWPNDTHPQRQKKSNKPGLDSSTQQENAEELQHTVSTLTTEPFRPQTLSHFSPENITDLCDMVQTCNGLNHIDQRFSESMGRTVTPIPIQLYTKHDVLNSRMSMAFADQSIAYVLSNTPALLRSFRSPDGTTLGLPTIVESFRNLRLLDYEPHKIMPCLAITTGTLYPDAVLKSRSPVLKARRSAKGVEMNRQPHHGAESPCVPPRNTLDNDETGHIIKIAFAALVAALPLLKPSLWEVVRILRASGFVAPDWYMDGVVLNVTILCEVMDALEDEKSIALMTKLVKVIAARNCADKMSGSSCQSRTDTKKSQSRPSDTIGRVYMEVVRLLMSNKTDIEAGDFKEHVELEKSAVSVTSAIVEWLRTVILKHWDGKPKVYRWGPVGGAIEQMSFLCKCKTSVIPVQAPVADYIDRRELH